jgi:Chaperone of endosialidase
MKNRNIIFAAILPVLACLALLSTAQAAPAPGTPDPTSTCAFCTADGTNALLNASAGGGTANSAFGWSALFTNTDASSNTAVGAGALLFNNGSPNTAVGTAALLFNTTGGADNALGAAALLNNTTGFFNNAVGRYSLQANTEGNENNSFGDDAMFNVTTGSSNTAFGDDALDGCTTGFSNVAVGDEAGTDVVTGDHIICIGGGVTGGGPFVDIPNTCYIGSIFDQVVSDPGTQEAVFVDQFNVVGIFNSSRRYKHDIQAMDKTSEMLYRLKPVTFKFNSDWKGTTQYGLIAEEVNAVNPGLVTRRGDGEISSVHYEQVNMMLLNEFLKEHKKVEEQQASISQLKSEMQTMVAQLKEQAAQIQKVSAQLQVNKPAAKVVVNQP